jgi:hypothetical protein
MMEYTTLELVNQWGVEYALEQTLVEPITEAHGYININ